jgi:hypothetical protein
MRAMTQAAGRLLTAIALASAPMAAQASETRATMGVSVTVARSCVVDTQPSEAGSSTVRLRCSRGRETAVLIGDGGTGSSLSLPAKPLRVEAERDAAGSEGVRSVTLNF